MKLIVLEDDFPVFNPEARMIKDFNALITRDKGSKGDHDGRKKRLATKELAFVHFMVYHNSEFVTSYSENERAEKIAKHLDMPEGWKPDAFVQLAMTTYEELTGTPSMESLKETREALFSANKIIRIRRKKLESALQELDSQLTGVDDEEEQERLDKLFKSTSDNYDAIMKIAEKMPTTLETINKLEERIKKEMQAEGKGRKQSTVNEWEM